MTSAGKSEGSGYFLRVPPAISNNEAVGRAAIFLLHTMINKIRLAATYVARLPQYVLT